MHISKKQTRKYRAFSRCNSLDCSHAHRIILGNVFQNNSLRKWRIAWDSWDDDDGIHDLGENFFVSERIGTIHSIEGSKGFPTTWDLIAGYPCHSSVFQRQFRVNLQSSNEKSKELFSRKWRWMWKLSIIIQTRSTVRDIIISYDSRIILVISGGYHVKREWNICLVPQWECVNVLSFQWCHDKKKQKNFPPAIISTSTWKRRKTRHQQASPQHRPKLKTWKKNLEMFFPSEIFLFRLCLLL